MNKKEIISDFLDNVKILIVTVIITLLFINFVAQFAVTCGNSMNDTLNNNDILLMEKLTQRFGELKRFDVIVFDSENEEHENYIKRIIGLPGETIRIDENGNIYINNKKLENDVYGNATIKDPGLAIDEITLNENEYFVLGDNRNNSLDSRFDLGAVELSQVKGKVLFSVFPAKKIYK